ncbi:MAG: molecular chaperone DnaJ [Myxococcota bacterium]
MPAVKRDYYQVLSLERDATGDDIKRAYRRLAIKYHPDRNPGDPHAEERFKEASEAYAILSDPDKRARYDRMGHAAFETGGPGGFDPSDFGAVADILEGLLGEMFRGRRRRARAGRDLTYDLHVTFEEAALGADKPIEVTRLGRCDACGGSGAAPGTAVRECPACKGRGETRFQRGFFAASRVCSACGGSGRRPDHPCGDCHGKGVRTRTDRLTVRIPAGVADGAVRTVRGAGEAAPGGAGDLHVTVRVQPHPVFSRKGADVLCTVPVTFPQAVLGDQIEVPTLEGPVKMKLPPGTPSGRVFRLRGKGIAVFGGAGKGDQLVEVVVEVPTKVTRKQRRLLEELAEDMGVDASPQPQGFLDKLKGLFD